MKIPLRELIELGRTAYDWVTAIRGAVADKDEQRIEALLPEELRTVVTLRMGKALAENLAITNRRIAEAEEES